MKFKLVKKVEGKVNCYGIGEYATGEIVEIPKHLAEKAKLNPNYEMVTDGDKGGTAGSSAGVPGKKGNRANG